jgi:probable rRNA maturation factor
MIIKEKNPQINIFNKVPSLKFSHQKMRKVVEDVIKYYKCRIENINLVFMDNREIKSVNKKYLNHNYATDVISFRLNKGKMVEGELYIGVMIAKENAERFKVRFYDEILRLIIHGSLHLLGFDDSTEEKRKKMSKMEDYFLGLGEPSHKNTAKKVDRIYN